MNEQAPQAEKKDQNNFKQYLNIALILVLLGLGTLMIFKSFTPAKKTIEENSSDTAINVMDENDSQPEDQTLNDIIDKQDIEFGEDEEDEVSTEGFDNASIEDTDEPESINRTNSSTQAAKTKVFADKIDEPKKLTKYMVITGSFGSITNARKRLEQTIIAGYRDAEIVQFDHSKYHTVCAIRTDNESIARASIQKLKNKKIDAFLHTQGRSK